MNNFATGWKQSYYGKGDVLVYRLRRDGQTPAGESPVFGANVQILIYGDAFWPTYTAGDNTGLIATDSMKNFIQRETANFAGAGLEEYCRFLGEKFLAIYPQVAGAQVTATEAPYSGIAAGTMAFAPSGPDRAWARLEFVRAGDKVTIAEAASGIRGFKLLRLGGSAFCGFVRDEYTTLPEIRNRPLHMWLDLDWRYANTAAAFTGGSAARSVKELVHSVFHGFESGSIQQIIYQTGTRLLESMPAVSEVNLEANNRTWDMVAEPSEALGIFTDARPPFGCLGLGLRR